MKEAEMSANGHTLYHTSQDMIHPETMGDIGHVSFRLRVDMTT